MVSQGLTDCTRKVRAVMREESDLATAFFDYVAGTRNWNLFEWDEYLKELDNCHMTVSEYVYLRENKLI